MAKLEEIVHVALDELRMQMLGAQVLFGFQLAGVFQEGFASVSRTARLVDAIALTLTVTTLGLLLATPCQHRLIEQGEVTHRIFRVAGHFAEIVLAPFALAIGCDIFVVTDRYWGTTPGLLAAFVATASALLCWYGLGWALRWHIASKEWEAPLPPELPTALHAKINQMLTEARVILPGAQALLGFQFVVTMTRTFSALPLMDRSIHFVALSAVALAMMLLLAPAAVHRLTFKGRDVERFHDIGSFLVTVALAPLAIGIAADFYIASAKMLDNRFVAAAAAFAIILLLGILWYAIPLLLRSASKREGTVSKSVETNREEVEAGN